MKVKGKTASLQSWIYHDDRKSLERWLRSQLHYMLVEARKLRETPATQGTYAILLTARGQKEDLLTGLESFLYRKAAICTGQSQEIVDYIASRKKKNVWLLRNGVSYPAFAEVLKSVFVAAAERELERTATAPTQSALSLLSGVHRKDVRQMTQLAERLRRMRELERAVDPVVIGQRQRLVAELRCLGRELLRERGSVQERIG